jgi:hypothetical protein
MQTLGRLDALDFTNALMDPGSLTSSFIDLETIADNPDYFAGKIRSVTGVSQFVANGETTYADKCVVLELTIVDADGINTTFTGYFIVLLKAVFTPEGLLLMNFIIGLPHLLGKLPDVFLRAFNNEVSDARSAGWQDLIFSIEQFHEEQQPDEVADYTDLSPAAFLTAIISKPLTKEEQQAERDRMVALRRTDEMAARQRDCN